MQNKIQTYYELIFPFCLLIPNTVFRKKKRDEYLQNYVFIKRLSFPRCPYSIDGIKAILRKIVTRYFSLQQMRKKKLKNIWRCRTADTRKYSLRIANDHKAVSLRPIELYAKLLNVIISRSNQHSNNRSSRCRDLV